MKNIQHYLPLPDCLTIRRSDIHGLGLFATKEIPKGTNLGMSHFLDDRFEGGGIRTPLGGFINHSNNPNITLITDKDIMSVKTLRNIMPDEELTLDYSPWYNEEVLATFK